MAGKDIEPGKRFDVSLIRERWLDAQMRQRRMREDKKVTDAFKEDLRKMVGVGTEFYLDGSLVATYYQTERFKEAELKSDNPELHEQYLVPRMSYEFDEERFKKENPAIWEQYRTASFNFK